MSDTPDDAERELRDFQRFVDECETRFAVADALCAAPTRGVRGPASTSDEDAASLLQALTLSPSSGARGARRTTRGTALERAHKRARELTERIGQIDALAAAARTAAVIAEREQLVAESKTLMAELQSAWRVSAGGHVEFVISKSVDGHNWVPLAERGPVQAGERVACRIRNRGSVPIVAMASNVYPRPGAKLGLKESDPLPMDPAGRKSARIPPGGEINMEGWTAAGFEYIPFIESGEEVDEMTLMYHLEGAPETWYCERKSYTLRA